MITWLHILEMYPCFYHIELFVLKLAMRPKLVPNRELTNTRATLQIQCYGIVEMPYLTQNKEKQQQ